MYNKIYRSFLFVILLSVWYGLALPACLNIESTFVFVGGIIGSFVITVETIRRLIKLWSEETKESK
jgi:uncharacterized membrane protein YdcZ (DUF606 family)